jgi:hypothetical protein
VPGANWRHSLGPNSDAKASLPDGMNDARQMVLDATAKKLQVTKTNSNYQKCVAY